MPDQGDLEQAKKIIDTHLRDPWGNCMECSEHPPARYPCDLARQAATTLGAAVCPAESDHVVRVDA